MKQNAQTNGRWVRPANSAANAASNQLAEATVVSAAVLEEILKAAGLEALD
jgi:hypothetical protein